MINKHFSVAYEVPSTVVGTRKTNNILKPTLGKCKYLCMYAQSSPTFCNPWTAAHQTLLFIAFSRQEHWSGFPFPSPGDFPNPGIEPISPASANRFFITEPPGKPRQTFRQSQFYNRFFFLCLMTSQSPSLSISPPKYNLNRWPQPLSTTILIKATAHTQVGLSQGESSLTDSTTQAEAWRVRGRLDHCWMFFLGPLPPAGWRPSISGNGHLVCRTKEALSLKKDMLRDAWTWSLHSKETTDY